MTRPVRVVVHHTLVELDLNHPRTARVLADAHELHRLVMSMFRHWVTEGEPNARALMGVLHTSAVDFKQRTLTLIVQSQVPPDTDALPRHMLAAPAHSRIVSLTVKAGQQYLFRTTVTPAVYGHHKGRHTRDRPTDTSPTAALTWFTQRLQPHPAVDYDRHPLIGADARPEDLKARQLPALAGHKPGQHVIVARSEIQGRLTITDPAAFARTLTQGLGRQRAYGCGLLLVQPLPTPRHTSPTEQQPCHTQHPGLPEQNTQRTSPTSSPTPSTPSPSSASAPPTPHAPPGPSTSSGTTSEPSTTTPAPAGTSNTPASTTTASTTPSEPYAAPPPGHKLVPEQPNGHTTPSTPQACASSTSRPPACTTPEPSTSPSAPQTASSSTP
ncbi:type I-E CRISPR-associated protein Cas6/Cse3/CasE [Streptomyces sp. MB09-01]|uniref:type I-E CRISPR-associated protein Cas6/Cse3/CasE n=1 Tax=Streptomyces sp. MB09-01 TaxID=3028666 RepID=UPI0029BC676B|nr:type I-E CRISPR-associated protein Cas6/Cse3/CasE [Streptomyces sp. MB09-01]MDX3540350.1 type I-E CRISPR-associated protein Cas6/Cse3/CasE [Streptomyces sp. MB09-01]